jgi:hypothetical protein
MISLDGATVDFQWRRTGSLEWRPAQDWPSYDANDGQTAGLPTRLRQLHAANRDWRERAQEAPLPLDFAMADRRAADPAARQRQAERERLELLARGRMAPRVQQQAAGPLFGRQADIEDF